MSEIKRVTAKDIVKVRTQQYNDPLEFAEMAAKKVEPLGGSQAFAEEWAKRREVEPWRDLANDLDGRITAICFSIANKEKKIARQQLLNYFSLRLEHFETRNNKSNFRLNADKLALELVKGFFLKDKKLGNLVHQFFDIQREQNQSEED